MAGQAGERRAMAALLEGLLVGAARPMESVAAWAGRLMSDHATPLAQRFIDELEAEWFPALPPDAFCEQVTAQVRDRLSAWHPGWPHLWAHVLRVTGAAVALAPDAGIDPALAYLMGICHDVAKLDEFRTGQPHEEAGAEFAGEVLRGHLAAAQIGSIQAAIRKESGGALGYLLHDADKLDKIGTAGLVRRISTGADPAWLPIALSRVADDTQSFPAMHFRLSADLAVRKRAFQAWFLPLAEDAIHGPRT
ncbi:MAG TPA: HD domain-containing protein [Aggregatilineaceae bacterium]|nr:HD domain-containing protein [Aggregatilineaceae bacterium]